jgi:peptidoglycan hydrolase CwlO-like protein|tara:strand:- start:60 stop:350 length:291 start_codon:yes stop_codon:yes gene_type:complete
MKSNSVVDKFISCFNDIAFNVICKPAKKIKVSETTLSATEKDLKKMLAKAKRELSKARKSNKHNKLSNEDLFIFESRVDSIKEDIDRLNDNDDLEA